MFWMNTQPEPDTNTCTSPPVLEAAPDRPNTAFCHSSVIRNVKAQILYSVTQLRHLFPKSARAEVEELMVTSEWLFLFFITDK